MTIQDDVLEVASLDLDGRGVARRSDGKVVFIDGALPGESVAVRVTRRKNQWEQAEAVAVLRESPMRVRPACPHFGLHAGACGGCKMQHLDAAAQVAVKQRVLEDNLWHLAKVKPARVLRPLQGPAWGYRHRARLSVRYVMKKGEVLVGFHERQSRYVADMKTCPVLPARISALLPALRALIGSMAQRDRLPQIELAAGDDVIVLVLRHLEPLPPADLDRLRTFGTAHGVQWWMQPGGPDSALPLDDAQALAQPLAYDLPEFGVRMPFRPTDFTQVNPDINRVLVGRSLRLLQPQAGERVIDWFCGLGNFTLPIARRASAVHGSRAARPWSSAHAPTLASTAWRAAPASRPAICSRSTPLDCRPRAGPNAGWSIHPGKAPSRWPRRWPMPFRRVCLTTRRPGSRRAASSTSVATRPRWRATLGFWCTRPAIAVPQPAS